MRPVLDSYDAAAFPPQDFTCPRCSKVATQRFPGPCAACIETLRRTLRGEVQLVDAEYVPKVNVTANAVALKDD